MEIRKNRKVALLLALWLPACAGHPASAMKERPIYSTSVLRVGIFNQGATLDRTAIESCQNQYANLEILDEIAVHRTIRDQGMTPAELLTKGDRFEAYEGFHSFHLLILTFRSKGKDYIRMVNFLGKYVSTVVLDLARPTCQDLFRAQRIIYFDSNPPLADIQVDGRFVGEAPTWVWLRDGVYTATANLPEQKFSPVQFTVPKQTDLLLKREAIQSTPSATEDEKMSTGDKFASVMLGVLGVAGAAAGVIIPYLLLKK